MAETYGVGKNWKNVRLACRIVWKDGDLILSIPSRMSIKTRQDYDIIDGIEAYNQGVVAKAPRYTFALSVPANTDASRALSFLSDNQEPFDLYIAAKEPTNLMSAKTLSTSDKDISDFKFLGECLRDCYLNGYELPVESQVLSQIAFDGIALGHDKQIWDATTHIIDWISRHEDTAGLLFGNGVLTDMTKLRAQGILDTWTEPQ